MKRQIALLALTAASSAFASVYWRGPANEPHGWADDDNRASGSGGFYWNTAESGSGGTWKQMPVNENAHVNNGGIAEIGDGVTADLGVNKLVLNYNQYSRVSEVRVLDGGTLKSAHVYVSHTTGGKGLLHLVGGEVYAGKSGEANAGLWIPGYNGSPFVGSSGEVRVEGGLLDIQSCLRVSTSDNANQQMFSGLVSLSGGRIVSHSLTSFGRDTTGANAASARLQQTGGAFVSEGSTFDDGLRVARGGTLDVSGGTFDAPRLYMRGGEANFTGGQVRIGRIFSEAGSTVRFGGDVVFNGTFMFMRGTGATPRTGVTNAYYVAGGSVTTTNDVGTDGWFGGGEPVRYVQTGGCVTNDVLYGRKNAGSGDIRLSVEGGVFYVNRNLAFMGQPFYFKIKGDPEVSFADFLQNSPNNLNIVATNTLIDHVIDARGLAPLVFRSDEAYRIFGRHVLRPSGGLQIVSTNRFALLRVSPSKTLQRMYFGATPDEALWSTGAFYDGLGNWGSTLKPEAVCGAAIGRKGGVRTFTARPNGYLDLPAIPSNRFESATVKLMVTPQDATLAEIAAGLEAEGYANVREIAEENANLAFEIPADRYPDACGTTKLLFDFTEPIVPDTFVGGPMEFPVRTNALVSACSIDVTTTKQGLVLMVR